jgi:hypothetical protein
MFAALVWVAATVRGQNPARGKLAALVNEGGFDVQEMVEVSELKVSALSDTLRAWLGVTVPKRSSTPPPMDSERSSLVVVEKKPLRTASTRRAFELGNTISLSSPALDFFMECHQISKEAQCLVDSLPNVKTPAVEPACRQLNAILFNPFLPLVYFLTL